jgi:hypothetical protein
VPYRIRAEFTAQSRLVAALMGLYAELDKNPTHERDVTPFAVFMAFSVEAYLNSIGFRVVPFWEKIERISWRKKIEILHSIADRKPEWGQQPLQFAQELFDLRDRLAHGKPEVLLTVPYATREEAYAVHARPDIEQPEWYRRLDRTWAVSAKAQFNRLMVYLGALHGFHESDHLLHSSGSIESTP